MARIHITMSYLSVQRRFLFAAMVFLSVSSSSCLSSVLFLSSRRRSQTARRPTYIPIDWQRRIQRIRTLTELDVQRNESLERKEGIIIENDSQVVGRLQAMKRETLRLLKEKKFDVALSTIKKMIAVVEKTQDVGGCRISMSAVVDESIQALVNLAFAHPCRGSATNERIRQGLAAIDLQVSSSECLAPPFDTVPRSTLVSALKALTGIVTNGNSRDGTSEDGSSLEPIDTAFRILQRLVTGRGVRHVAADQSSELSEKDFNLVLNAASHIGRMDLAHKILALQERTTHAPPLSPVAYSILLKGYGRLHDIQNVRMILSHAGMNGVVPDTIMLNSVIDAFVNCNDFEAANNIFRCVKDPDFEGHEMAKYSSLFETDARPIPNRRTYNTVLKGLAKLGEKDAAVELSHEMEAKDLWDDITTNTLVSAAIKACDFDLAKAMLANHTAVFDHDGKRKNHPNVEAYTELLDAYAKASQLDNALGVLKLMNQKGVEPNEYTYTCMIGGLARAKKVDQALRMLQFMETKGIKPRVVTYNAFMSGLVADMYTGSGPDLPGQDDFTHYVSDAMKLLPRMLKNGVCPNSVTISVLVDGLGRCDPPRLPEAKALVSKFRKDGIISGEDRRVASALIRTCGAAHDLKGALENFRSLKEPDLVTVNAFLDACCRCEKEKLAFEAFKHYFGEDNTSGKLTPDVITYSILISALLKQGTPKAMQRSIIMYNEMKQRRSIMPDKVLSDIILSAMVRGGRIGLTKRDIQFARTVLRDAEKLDWGPGQFEKRRQSVGAVLIGRVSEVWKENESWYGMASPDDNEEEDELFKKKGWNKVDSGFRLWGGGLDDVATRKIEPDSERVVDEFLASKGWNDVDSGFRII